VGKKIITMPVQCCTQW